MCVLCVQWVASAIPLSSLSPSRLNSLSTLLTRVNNYFDRQDLGLVQGLHMYCLCVYIHIRMHRCVHGHQCIVLLLLTINASIFFCVGCVQESGSDSDTESTDTNGVLNTSCSSNSEQTQHLINTFLYSHQHPKDAKYTDRTYTNFSCCLSSGLASIVHITSATPHTNQPYKVQITSDAPAHIDALIDHNTHTLKLNLFDFTAVDRAVLVHHTYSGNVSAICTDAQSTTTVGSTAADTNAVAITSNNTSTQALTPVNIDQQRIVQLCAYLTHLAPLLHTYLQQQYSSNSIQSHYGSYVEQSHHARSLYMCLDLHLAQKQSTVAFAMISAYLERF